MSHLVDTYSNRRLFRFIDAGVLHALFVSALVANPGREDGGCFAQTLCGKHIGSLPSAKGSLVIARREEATCRPCQSRLLKEKSR